MRYGVTAVDHAPTGILDSPDMTGFIMPPDHRVCSTRSAEMKDLLEPVNLLERIRLGQEALVQGLDPTQGYMPYWNVRCEAGQVAGLFAKRLANQSISERSLARLGRSVR